MTKQCSKCKKEKPYTEFHKSKSVDGYRGDCKICRREYRIKLYIKNGGSCWEKKRKDREKREKSEIKKCSGCKKRKQMKEFTADKTRPGGRRDTCRICRRLADKKHREKNLGKYRELAIDYYYANKEQYKKTKAKYIKNNKEKVCKQRNKYKKNSIDNLTDGYLKTSIQTLLRRKGVEIKQNEIPQELIEAKRLVLVAKRQKLIPNHL